MLVNGVFVIEVADHPGADPLKFRKYAAEQSPVVHLRQPRVESGPRLQERQQRIALHRRREEVLRPITVHVLLNQRQRFVRDRHVVRERRLKGADPGVGLARRALLVDEADTGGRADEIDTDRNGSRLAHPFERSIDEARVSEVLAHQPFDALLRLRPRAIQGLRRVLLELVGQHVVVPFPLQMQNGPDAQQKVLGLVQTCRVGRTVSEQGGVGQPRDRAHRQQVAQRPGRVLRVRLELVEACR